jgi:hypothetical protein
MSLENQIHRVGTACCRSLNQDQDTMTFWIEFNQHFTDFSEGKTIEQAVGKLGMKMSDVKSYKEIE